MYGIPEFYYGQVSDLSKEELWEKQHALLEQRDHHVQEECGDCSRLHHCNGGCPAEAYDLCHDYTKPNCDYKVKQLIRTHIKERLKDDSYYE